MNGSQSCLPRRLVFDSNVQIAAQQVTLDGRLTVPENTYGLVIFVHGSGSSRHSPRNRYVATALNQAGLATLLFDLLTTAEEFNRANVFDITLLAGRLIDASVWASTHPPCAGLPIAYFGASTGAAAALRAATDTSVDVAAVVSRGGRPDLAGVALRHVHTPTLLIVGGKDPVTFELNQQAQAQIHGICELAVVSGATHLFEEPGALERVAELAREWFARHISQSAKSRPSPPADDTSANQS